MLIRRSEMNKRNSNVVHFCGEELYMSFNLILTFDSEDAYGNSQEIFDLKISVSKNESNAVTFIHKKLFKEIIKKCTVFNRRPEDLLKISTHANWDLFEEVTRKKSLPSLGHSSKWNFGEGRSDLDLWEQKLMQEYGFGSDCDASWINAMDPISYRDPRLL